jgi:hypothetical protein
MWDHNKTISYLCDRRPEITQKNTLVTRAIDLRKVPLVIDSKETITIADPTQTGTQKIGPVAPVVHAIPTKLQLDPLVLAPTWKIQHTPITV